MGRGPRANLTIFAATLAVAFCGGQGFAQTPASPTTGTVNLTSRIDYNTNPGLLTVGPVPELSVSERFSFSLTTETRNQSLTASGAGSLRLVNVGGANSFNFTQPNLNLTYMRDVANASVSANFNYWSGEVVSSFDSDPTAAVVLVVDSGTLTTTRASVGLQYGITAPLGVSVNLSQNRNVYAGTTDPSLFDSTTTTLAKSLSMRISPVTQGQLDLSFSDYNAADATMTSTQTTNLGFSVSHELRSALLLQGDLGVQSRTTAAGGPASTRTGVNAGLKLTQTTPRGDIFAGVRVDQTGPPNITSLNIGRTLPLPAGQLSGSVTASNVSGTGLQLYGDAAYNQQLADGSIDVSLSQSLTTDVFDQDVLLSRINLGYTQNVTANSSVNLGVNVTRSSDAGSGAAPTQNRGSLTASYDRMLTPEWDMSVGYQHSFYSSSTSPLANSDELFLTLTRNIQFGF